MKCPYCDKTLASVLCPECGGETPEGSLYCCRCGKPTRIEKAETDPSERIPCSDGNCIGTINEKRVCNVCGNPYVGEGVS
jgi:hypothetical protein